MNGNTHKHSTSSKLPLGAASVLGIECGYPCIIMCVGLVASRRGGKLAVIGNPPWPIHDVGATLS